MGAQRRKACVPLSTLFFGSDFWGSAKDAGCSALNVGCLAPLLRQSPLDVPPISDEVWKTWTFGVGFSHDVRKNLLTNCLGSSLFVGCCDNSQSLLFSAAVSVVVFASPRKTCRSCFNVFKIVARCIMCPLDPADSYLLLGAPCIPASSLFWEYGCGNSESSYFSA